MIRNATKWQGGIMIALGVMVFALNSSATAREGGMRCLVNERPPRPAETLSLLKHLDNWKKELTGDYKAWYRQYVRAVELHKQAVKEKQTELASQHARTANHAVAQMKEIELRIGMVQLMIRTHSKKDKDIVLDNQPVPWTNHAPGQDRW